MQCSSVVMETLSKKFIDQRELFMYAFETFRYKETCQMCFSPLHLLVTLEDGIYETRKLYNTVKKFSVRNNYKDGHRADAFADPLSRIVLEVRLRR